MPIEKSDNHQLPSCDAVCKRRVAVIIGVLLMAAAPLLYCPPQTELAPPRAFAPPRQDTLFTSTRSITSLLVDKNGALWAATSGGVLRRSKEAEWTKYTRRDGLPSNEARLVQSDNDGNIQVILPRAIATFENEKWRVQEIGAPPSVPGSLEVEWNGNIVQAAPDVFRTRPKNPLDWRNIELPNSRGSHVSALLVQKGVLWAALFGDGIWSFDGQKWQRLDIALPKNTREITALAFDENTRTLWVGTRRDGIWRYSLSGWQQRLQADEPIDHNAQYLAFFKGDLYMSSLDDGLHIRGADGWRAQEGSTLSSSAPRHLVSYAKKLWVRHGNGKVDSFDGKAWKLDAFAFLSRKKTFALAADKSNLCVAQWGGWSEWNGKVWNHFLKLPELQGLPIMAILPIDDKVWIGTQSRGVAEYSHTTQKLIWHDERHGLPDDWITCFAKSEKMLYAGTFVGGLAMFDGKNWKTIKDLEDDDVTDLKADGQGGVFITTRRGVWHRNAAGKMKKLNAEYSWLDSEAQTLLPTEDGLWVGARTSLTFLKNKRPLA